MIMGRVKGAESVDLYEVGNEPEYFISKLVKFDAMPNGLVRLYLGSTRGDHSRLEYTVVVSTTDLILMAKEAIQIATKIHNDLTMAGGKPN